ncbi:MAG TPA: hypothetical protein VGE07_16965 [Herpetosiphonaceae bacterium]
MRWRRFQVFLAILVIIHLAAHAAPARSQGPVAPAGDPVAASAPLADAGESLSLTNGYLAVPAAATPQLAGEWSTFMCRG